MDGAVREVFGNASSTHATGQLAHAELEKARKRVASVIQASPVEIVFTSGGTESNNLAILGLVRNIRAASRHVVTTTVEHAAVLECCRQLEREGVSVTYVPVDYRGAVDVHEIRRSIRPDTVLVSVMHANNETGTLQPIEAIGEIVRDLRAARQQIFLHSDGVQALGKIADDVNALGVDLYSMSAHKVFGPKGVGALFVRRGAPVHGVLFGGRHERERRAGTENVPGAIAFARALELCTPDDRRVTELRDTFEAQVRKRIPDVEINGVEASRLPNTSNLLFRGVSAEAMVIALDMRGMAVSTGSACSSGSVEPSHVLVAMKRSLDEAKSSVRFSFGRYNTFAELRQLVDAVVECVNKLRRAPVREAQFAR